MSKKYTSTILLFAVFIGFFIWGGSMLYSSVTASVKDGESIVYAVMILGCSLVALVAILMLPKKRNS
ncbi:hypothetical protein KDA_33230 [Dictyobacter alpinus]|uniref:Uncharacterized protein n=1 Tax=Dictyobacter alpinus TaxID=2014873 RepID=A0A402B944_9CHLR|nr:hypothetical protein [Dictyobacter alpinus]GCE27839.1 hypothetical protein KDA_33230 [Dictyobacter alpinus]